MAEYIEREAVLEIAMQYCPDDDGSCSKAGVDIRVMLDEIEAIPAADVVPVVRCGEWKPHSKVETPVFHCSVCGGAALHAFGKQCKSDYCPNCGAMMKGDGDDV